MSIKINEFLKNEFVRLVGQLIVVGLVGYFSVQRSFSDSIAGMDKRLTVVEGNLTTHLQTSEVSQDNEVKDMQTLMNSHGNRLSVIETNDIHRDEAIKDLTAEISRLRIAVAELAGVLKARIKAGG